MTSTTPAAPPLFDPRTIGDQLGRSVTLIAGGARGVGRRAAENLLAIGGRVAVVDLMPDRVEAARAELASYGDRFLALRGDCTDRADMKRVVFDTVAAFGELTGVVYAAGAYRAQRPTLEVDPEEWDLILDSNLKGAFLTFQAAIPALIESGGGSIVSISSLAGRTSSPFLGCHYSAAKAGVLGLVRHLAKEFGPAGVRANSICPGGIAGQRMNDLLRELDREADLRVLAEQTPLQRNVEEHDVVGAILFLLSDLSRFVTGATVDVNGGILTV